MLNKIVYLAVFVSDQDRALEFYANTLGLEKRFDNPTPEGPRFLTLAVPGQDVELVLWPGTPGRAKPTQGGLPAALCTFEVEDCRLAFETLKARGVRFEPPEIVERPWGFVARFQDPDGNLLQLRQARAMPDRR